MLLWGAAQGAVQNYSQGRAKGLDLNEFGHLVVYVNLSIFIFRDLPLK